MWVSRIRYIYTFFILEILSHIDSKAYYDIVSLLHIIHVKYTCDISNIYHIHEYISSMLMYRTYIFDRDVSKDPTSDYLSSSHCATEDK